MRKPPISIRSFLTFFDSRTRIGIWRVPVLNCATFAPLSPIVAIRMVLASAAAVTPISAASFALGVIWISGRLSAEDVDAPETSGRVFMAAARSRAAAAASSSVSPRTLMAISRAPLSFNTVRRTSGKSVNMSSIWS